MEDICGKGDFFVPSRKTCWQQRRMTVSNMIKRHILLVLLVLAVSTTMQAQTASEWRDSLAELNRQIRQWPTSVDLRLKKAAVNIELGQWEYAIDEYSKVLEMDSRNLAALYFRAYANNNLRHYDLSMRDYEAFLAVVPKHFEAQLGLAMVKRKMGRRNDALDELNRLVQLFPDSTMAYAARASYEAELQQWEVALYDWDEAMKRDPKNVDFLVSKVDILLRLKRYDEAWALLQDAMKRGVPRSALKEWIDRCK